MKTRAFAASSCALAILLASCQDSIEPLATGHTATPDDTISAPFFTPFARTYPEALTVEIRRPDGDTGGEVHCTVDGTLPTRHSPRCSTVVVAESVLTIRAIFVDGGASSSVVGGTYRILRTGRRIWAPWAGDVAFGSLKDARDGRVYITVRIGNQNWMAENLDYRAAGADSGWWFKGSRDSGDKHGRLYTWAGAMGLGEDCGAQPCSDVTQSRRQGICPSGWHVPRDSEWLALLAAVSADPRVGFGWNASSLRAVASWAQLSQPTPADDIFGFRALPSGFQSSIGAFASFPGGHLDASGYGYAGLLAVWWSSSRSADSAAVLALFCLSRYAGLSWSDVGNRHSLRCLQD